MVRRGIDVWRKPLDGAVVEVHVAHLGLGGKRVGVHGVPVVLRRDVDAPGLVIAHGMVAATVPELQLVGGAAQGVGDHLMPEADAHDGPPPQQGLRAGDHVVEGGRVAWAGRQQDAVRVGGEDLLGGGRGGDGGDVAAARPEQAQDVVLDPHVHDGDAPPRAGAAAPGLSLLRRDRPDVVLIAVGGAVAEQLHRLVGCGLGGQHAHHHASVAQAAGDCPRIDAS